LDVVDGHGTPFADGTAFLRDTVIVFEVVQRAVVDHEAARRVHTDLAVLVGAPQEDMIDAVGEH
jgi:hypothetical protein